MHGKVYAAVLRVLEEAYPCDLSFEEISSKIQAAPEVARIAMEQLAGEGLAFQSRTVSGTRLFTLDKVQLGLKTFNEGKFFEAHEILEDVWRNEEGPPKNFYRGLINLGVGFAHWQNRKPRAATSVLTAAKELLETYAPSYDGVEVAPLLTQIERSIDVIMRGADESRKAKISVPTIERTVKHRPT
ncbi:MAG: DUF309 domain-containing protein [Candidatus Geothermarchaeales archaeon]